jgi:PfaB family protein
MERIAVIGMSCLFPGAQTPEAFWKNLLEQKDSRSPVTDEKMRLNVRDYYDPHERKAADKFYCMQGGYVHDFEMDPTGFQIPPDYIASLDDVYQWSLHVGREALKDSGYWGNEDARTRCGVILGNLSFPTKSSNYLFLPIYHEAVESCLQQLLEDRDFRLTPFSLPGNMSADNGRISGYPAAVISRALSLSGVHLSLDAACASSLYSVKLACDYLLTRKADMMLAGAVSAADPLFIHMGFSIFQAYPEEGAASSPLDEKSKGLVAGEGAGMFVLKRYSDALRDGDRIHAVIRGIGLSNDGKGQSVLSPNIKGQLIAFERAYADAEVDPKSIQYIECHATGTPLGDKVEVNSMDAFFGRHGASPMVGSVKSNLGHLLTAAGMASMTKVILSMREGTIPATINLKEPQGSTNRVITPPQIPMAPTAWPRDGSIRRAAVSAFGFGGTNAHLVIEQASKEPIEKTQHVSVSRDRVRTEKLSPVAIVGMDALFGSCRGLSAFHRTTYNGLQHFISLPPERWKGIEDHSSLLERYGFEDGEVPLGAFIDNFELDFLRFKIPPNEEDRLIPQQLLALKVADAALQKTRVEPGQNVAVIIAMETELSTHQMRGRVNLASQLEQSLPKKNKSLSPEEKTELQAIAKDSVHNMAQANQYTSFIGNIMACRISSLWDFSGPAFTVSSEENSVFKALEVAQMLLDSAEVEAVVLGSVDLSGGVENVLWRNSRHKLNTGKPTFSFDETTDGWTVGEGAGAVVLKRLDRAKEDGEQVYASIDAIGIANGTSQESITHACRQALQIADVEPSQIGYLEVFASGIPEEDEAEMAGLIQAYKSTGHDLQCAIGSVKATIGHTFAASGMASLIKTALCLYHQYLPGTPGWSAPKHPEKWDDSPFYVLTESKTWFLKEGEGARIAAISGVGQDGTSAHLILSKDEAIRKSPPNSHLVETPLSMFFLAGDDQTALLKELEMLRQAVLSGSSLATVARACFEHCHQHAQAEYALSIMGSNKEDILQEIAAARAGVEKAFFAKEPWSSLRGSYFTPNPLSLKGKIAFVYPGGLNSYVGLGRDFFQAFPEMYEEAYNYSSQVEQMIGDRLIYPRSMRRLSQKDLNAFEKQLIDTPITMFENGIMFAILYTRLMRNCFHIEPQMAIGYSMGEVSMWYSLGVWGKTDEMSRILHESPVFRTRLAGPMETVREAWNLPKATDEHEKIWYCYSLKTSAANARKALKKETRAYLIFVNAPNEVIIAGDNLACERVIKKLRCEYFEVPMSDVIHCELARADYDGLASMHMLPVKDVPGINFYSADTFAPLPIDSKGIANNIATIYCREIDFERLVHQAYKGGARIFLELGPRENCTNWIGEILAEQEHLAVAANRKGADDRTSILRTLAKLHSHRVDMDLSLLYPEPEARDQSKRSVIKSTSLGGVRIESAILKEENKKRFARSTAALDEQSVLEPSAPRLPVAKPQTPPRPTAAAPISHQIGIDEGEATGAPSPDTVLTAFSRFDQNLSRLNSSHSGFLQTRKEGLKQIGEMIAAQMSLTTQARMSAPSLPEISTPRHSAPARSDSIEQATAITAMREPVRVPEPEGSLTLDELLRRYPPRGKGSVGRTKPPGEVFDYGDLREFAEGSIGKVFGEQYALIDNYRRRVRLPLEPYLLVSRVTELDAETGAFKPSSMTTEYDIPYGAWYSVDGQIPWAVAVESGQCDLLLISYLGIDFDAKGDRVYRLLDCTLTFLEDVPQEGDTLRYEIKINSFAKTGGPLLFFFSYDCYVKDKLMIEMRGGCAGFFTDQELEAGKGVIHTEQELEERQQIQKKHFDPILQCEKTSFDSRDLVELARDNEAACFGPAYARGDHNPSMHLTAEPMLMMDRVLSVDPNGGAWGLGLIVAEKDLAPDHWYFPCHFKDDQVLAGSLMAEGCGQLMRFYMWFLGLQTCTENARFQPIPRLPQKVRCRGQVIPKDTMITYRMEVKEIGTHPNPYAIADVDILLGDKIVVDFKDLGVVLSEQDAGKVHPQEAASPQVPEETPAEDRDKGALFTKYHLEEFATGRIANCFGPDFDFYDNRRSPRTPNGDLQLISRVLKVKGARLDMKNPASVVTEYDVPEDVWFFSENSHPAVIPYSMLMEISLQPNGFLSAWMGTTLPAPDKDFCFRNLDGEGTILRTIDLRGKTITNYSELLSSVASGNTIIQQFRFELSHDGLPFYKGTAVFGYFLPEALANQIGLDRGISNNPLQTKEYLSGGPIVDIDLRSSAAREQLYRGTAEKPYYHLAGPQLDFLDSVQIVEQGGKYEQGYVCGYKKIDPSDWFYPCHFYQDPVMPGSLGVESILQAVQIFALQQDLGSPFKSPRFAQLLDHKILWKYRGQLIPSDDQMVIDIHIKKVDKSSDRVAVVADASLWKNEIRIYTVTDAAICLEEER